MNMLLNFNAIQYNVMNKVDEHRKKTKTSNMFVQIFVNKQKKNIRSPFYLFISLFFIKNVVSKI